MQTINVIFIKLVSLFLDVNESSISLILYPSNWNLFYRFHFAKALFAKLKSKFRLGAVFNKKAPRNHRKLAFVLRQYFCLPLLRPHHVHAQVLRLEGELKIICKSLATGEARRVNLFHNYVVTYWCQLIGPESFSVFGASHTTNNRLER